MLIGKQPIGLAQAWADWRAGMSVAESPALHILLSQRLPRTLAACLAGGGLALVGCVFQAVLRNPLATPYTLGIASAGALGAYVALVLVDAGVLLRAVLGVPMVQGLAFVFALCDVLLIYLMATRRARPSPTVLLLTGVTLGIIANAGIMLARFFARPERLIDMDRWLMGGVDVLGFQPAGIVALAVLAGRGGVAFPGGQARPVRFQHGARRKPRGARGAVAAHGVSRGFPYYRGHRVEGRPCRFCRTHRAALRARVHRQPASRAPAHHTDRGRRLPLPVRRRQP